MFDHSPRSTRWRRPVAVLVAGLLVVAPPASAQSSDVDPDPPVAIESTVVSLRPSCQGAQTTTVTGTRTATIDLERNRALAEAAAGLPGSIAGTVAVDLDHTDDSCRFGVGARARAAVTFEVPAGDVWTYELTGAREGTRTRRSSDPIQPGDSLALADVHIVAGSDPGVVSDPSPESGATPPPDSVDPNTRSLDGPFRATGTLASGTWTVVMTMTANQTDLLPRRVASAEFILAFEQLERVPLDFDYTARPRYGADADGDGRTDQMTTRAQVDPPGGFLYDLALTDCPAETVRLTWRDADGAVLASGNSPGACAVTVALPDEGLHVVEVAANDPATSGSRGRRVETVEVVDHLIVSVGDSVASGEGASEVPVPRIGWGDEQCHRSAAAGPSVAARAIEAADPKSSVTFVHLACSGATITEGLLGPYTGIIEGPALPPQLDEMARLAGDRRIDAVTVSIGANDIEFSAIVEDCVERPHCDRPGGAGAARYERLAPTLPGRYELLAQAFADRGVAADRVVLTEYYNPVRDASNRPCEGGILLDGLPFELTRIIERFIGPVNPLVGRQLTPPVSQFLQITGEEAAWAEQVMLTGLNRIGDTAAEAHGWRRVTGMFDDFGPHGYCSGRDRRWVQTYDDSILAQGDKNGTLHPNVAGHANSFGPRIAAELEALLG